MLLCYGTEHASATDSCWWSVRTDRVDEVDVSAHCSLVNLHHWSIVVSHRHLRIARVSLHNFTHCFQLHTDTQTPLPVRIIMRPYLEGGALSVIPRQSVRSSVHLSRASNFLETGMAQKFQI